MPGRRRSAAEWRALVAEWRASGQSRGTFATVRGLSPRTLGWWAWRLGATADPGPEFVELVVADAVEAAPPDLVVEVGVVRVHVPVGFDARELRRLVDALC